MCAVTTVRQTIGWKPHCTHAQGDDGADDFVDEDTHAHTTPHQQNPRNRSACVQHRTPPCKTHRRNTTHHAQHTTAARKNLDSAADAHTRWCVSRSLAKFTIKHQPHAAHTQHRVSGDRANSTQRTTPHGTDLRGDKEEDVPMSNCLISDSALS